MRECIASLGQRLVVLIVRVTSVGGELIRVLRDEIILIVEIRIMPWQFGVLNLTEDGGFRTIKYSDQIFRGVREPMSL